MPQNSTGEMPVILMGGTPMLLRCLTAASRTRRHSNRAKQSQSRPAPAEFLAPSHHERNLTKQTQSAPPPAKPRFSRRKRVAAFPRWADRWKQSQFPGASPHLCRRFAGWREGPGPGESGCEQRKHAHRRRNRLVAQLPPAVPRGLPSRWEAGLRSECARQGSGECGLALRLLSLCQCIYSGVVFVMQLAADCSWAEGANRCVPAVCCEEWPAWVWCLC